MPFELYVYKICVVVYRENFDPKTIMNCASVCVCVCTRWMCSGRSTFIISILHLIISRFIKLHVVYICVGRWLPSDQICSDNNVV